MKNIYDFFGGRKYFFSLLLLLISVIFVASGKATFSEFSDYVMWIFGIYSAGNVGSKVFNKPSINP
jgi:nitrate/nitrite transporter NarK